MESPFHAHYATCAIRAGGPCDCPLGDEPKPEPGYIALNREQRRQLKNGHGLSAQVGDGVRQGG